MLDKSDDFVTFDSEKDILLFLRQKIFCELHNKRLKSLMYKEVNFGEITNPIASEVRYESIKGQWIKVLTPKQMFQRLPIAVTLIKEGNTSEFT